MNSTTERPQHHPAVEKAIAKAPLVKRAAYDAAIAKEEEARLAFNDARFAALNASPRELWKVANNAVWRAIDAAPAADREVARVAADAYLTAYNAANAAYAAVLAAAPEKERKAIQDANATIAAIHGSKSPPPTESSLYNRKHIKTEIRNM